MRSFQLFVCLSLVLVTVACSKTPNLSERLGGEAVGIFSDRPLRQDQFIAIIKLQSPALLTSAKKEEGKMVIDAELAQKIEQEQMQAVSALKALSSEIRVIYRFRRVLNGLVVVAPSSLKDRLRSSMHVAYVESEGRFDRPAIMNQIPLALGEALKVKERNSSKFIGAEEAQVAGIQGQGMKVGIIDTGIDFTHSMMGGEGTEAAFQAVDPSKPHASFPNSKVIGGIDLVGSEYDTSSGNYRNRLPTPDENPMDEAGHGTHVAGTVAGIGNGTETYSGVAPAAELYAIKVFGKNGTTGTAPIIAALEYSADPNGDGMLDDQMDVINLSLGSSYGHPNILYGEAIRNLSNGGTVVVASAGNAGPLDYIVGSPSVADEAISVAASVDDAYHNWQFQTVKFTSSLGTYMAIAVEGPISRPIEQAGPVVGKLVYVGTAKDDFPADLVAAVKGHVALIDRGEVAFGDKLQRAAQAGAIGVVMANNQPGDPIQMGGEGSVSIPAVMITQDLGIKLKEEMKTTDVQISFQSDEKVGKPELIDTLTDFSSKGPRSIDGFLKPEISAPGQNVISAAMGGGTKGIQMSGTSMSGPHIAGVMALLKQAHPSLNSKELKSVLMGRAKTIQDEAKNIYPLSRQGAGRVQVMESVRAQLVADRVSISLGEINIENQKVIREVIQLKNISQSPVAGRLELQSAGGMTLENPQDVNLNPGESKSFTAKIRLKAPVSGRGEMDGLLVVTQKGAESHRIPVLAIAKKISQIQGSSLKVMADSAESATGSLVQLNLRNMGFHEGSVLPFNLLGVDKRKENPTHDAFRSRACDLQAVGYRIIEKMAGNQKIKVLQVGAKIYEPMTTWNACELSVLIDTNGDQDPEQELAATEIGNVRGLMSPTGEPIFASILLDAVKARAIRAEFEQSEMAGPFNPNPVSESYAPAIIGALSLSPFNQSTVVLVEAELKLLAKRPNGSLALKVATIFNDPNAIEMDDFLGNSTRNWHLISLEDQSQGFTNLPESLTLKAGESGTVEFSKGAGRSQLLLLYPDNRTVFSDNLKDGQMQILRPQFKN
jgi:minor extracellular serine protease Vpr